MQRSTNIFDKIGSLIPGYSGYVERDGRRKCDKLLREKIAGILDSSENIISEMIATSIKNKDFVHIEEYDEIKKKINTLKSRIKYLTYGESAFFSNSQIKEDELLRIYQYDLTLYEKINELLKYFSKFDFNRIKSFISEIEFILNERNNYIREFK